MKIPEKPPNFKTIFEENNEQFWNCIKDNHITDFVRKTTEKYLYWNKFKYLNIPKGVSAEVVWACREYFAMSQAKQIPLIDKKGTPFSYWLPDKAMEYLHFIDRNAAGKIEVIDDLPTQKYRDRLIVSSLIEEAIASSQIEGAQTTIKRAKDMLREEEKPKNKSEQMIVNNYIAIKKTKEIKNCDINIDEILNLHSILTENTLEDKDIGRFRKDDVDDKIEIIDYDGSVLHRPPESGQLNKRMNGFLEFANYSQKEFIHPVIKAIILHFWVGYDHPFIDGNGRTARALFYWYMLKQGYWLFEFISISKLVARTYGQYKRAFLYSEISDNDMTYFIMYHLKLIKLAIVETQNRIYRKQKALKQRESLIVRKFPNLNYRQRELLKHAQKRPDTVYTIKGHSKFHLIVHQTARNDLLNLCDKGLFQKSISGKTLIFFVPEDFDKILDSKIT